MIIEISQRRSLGSYYEQREKRVREFYRFLPKMLKEKFPFSICLSYMFFRLEQGQLNSLYCGAVKQHNLHHPAVSRALDKYHMTRDNYKQMVKVVFGKAIDKEATNLIEETAKIRDRLMHGKEVTSAELRSAIAEVLVYTEQINDQISDRAGGLFRNHLIDLQKNLDVAGKTFAYRVALEIARFMVLANEQTEGTEEDLWTAFDMALLQKVVAKFHGTSDELTEPIKTMNSFIAEVNGISQGTDTGNTTDNHTEQGGENPAEGGSTEYTRLIRTREKLLQMQKKLQSQGYVSYLQ